MRMHFSGDTQNCAELLQALLPELGMENAPTSEFEVKLTRGDGLHMEIGATSAQITYGSRAMLGRVLPCSRI